MKDILIRTGIKPGDGLYFDRDSRVLVDSPRFVRAFELAREVRRHKLDASVSTWSNEWSRGPAPRHPGHRAVGRLDGRATSATGWRPPPGPVARRACPRAPPSATAVPSTPCPARGARANKAMAWALVQLHDAGPRTPAGGLQVPRRLPGPADRPMTTPSSTSRWPSSAASGARRLWRDAARRITGRPRAQAGRLRRRGHRHRTRQGAGPRQGHPRGAGRRPAAARRAVPTAEFLSNADHEAARRH